MAKLGQYNLDEMTAQEAFEASAMHLFEQSEKSLGVDGYTCAYNGFGSTCCAAGIFLQNYAEHMEGEGWGRLISFHEQTDEHRYLVLRLQAMHDNCECMEWKERLKLLGDSVNLDTGFLDNWEFNKEAGVYIENFGLPK